MPAQGNDVTPEMPVAPATVTTNRKWRLPRRYPPPPAAFDGTPPSTTTTPLGPWKSVTIVLFGIVCPLLLLGVELAFHPFADIFFDPFPTNWHVALFAAAVAGTGLVFWGLAARAVRYYRWLGWVNGIVIGIMTWYVLQFLPLIILSPVALIFCLLFPPVLLLVLGVLASPLALVAAINARVQLTPTLRKAWPTLWLGMLLGFLLLLALELSGAWTKMTMQQAVSRDPRVSRRAIAALRRVGNRHEMLLRCYTRPHTEAGLLSLLIAGSDDIASEDARKLYYRVTGEPFNSLPAPVNTTRGGSFSETLLDNDQGSDRVAAKVEGLSLQSSRLDGSVDADAALGYLEWIVTFANTAASAGEARMQVALPPGATVSRLTLWIDGEEREAAFAARGRVREAYQEVAIVRQRDPVLVTTCGPDRVLVQCFPVPAGGTMKVRLGITAPLVLDEPASGWLALPRIVEANFDAAADLRHQVWLEANSPLTEMPGLRAERAGAAYAVRGAVADGVLRRSPAAVRCARDPRATQAWTPDVLTARQVIRQSLAPVVAPAPDRVVLVIDGSRCMRASLPAIGAALADLPPGSEFAVLVAGDAVRTLVTPRMATPSARALAADRVRALRCDGGMDNIPALTQAWDLAAASRNGVILWVHGPQPVLEAPDALVQRWERRPAGPRLYALEAVAGDNAPLRELDRVPAVCGVPRLGELGADLARLLATWRGVPRLVATRERVDAGWRNRAGGGRRTSGHLARLWAQEQAQVYDAQRTPAMTERAVALATCYQVVTPVTGAVVLENQQQYAEHGLEPMKPGSVPTVPEPETWLLLGVAGLVLLYVGWRRRKTCVAA